MLDSLGIRCFDQGPGKFSLHRSRLLMCCNQLPDAGWSTIGIENRNTKFFGLCFKCFMVQASLVGNQCLVSGVSSHTSKILYKCASSCTSPESCHLNHLDFLELINSAMASTQRGSLILFKRLY
jgi:hypothetical protein